MVEVALSAGGADVNRVLVNKPLARKWVYKAADTSLTQAARDGMTGWLIQAKQYSSKIPGAAFVELALYSDDRRKCILRKYILTK